MNIKSLLLGSAAALVAVTGARAADVIVPAAEPAEYVKVCDVYGEGFYYIPGTETCMQVSGYVRFKYVVNGDTDGSSNIEGDDYDARSNVRVRLNFDVREETELGTLRAFARLQATNDGTVDEDEGYGMDLGYIQLGGLTMGYLDTLWTEGDGLLTDTDLPVGDFQVNRISYTAAYGAFSIAGSVEDDANGNFAPNFVGRVGYESDLFGAYGMVAVDAGNNEMYQSVDNGVFALTNLDNPNDAYEAPAVALKGGISFKPVENGELKFEGSYAFDPTVYSSLGLYSGAADIGQFSNIGGALPVEWQVGAGYAQTFGKLGVAVAGVYGETFDFYNVDYVAVPGVTDLVRVGGGDNLGTGEYYKLVGNVGYEITNNFDVLGEVSYTNVDFDSNSIDQTSGFIQFVRSF